MTELAVDGRSTLLRAVFRAYERVIEQQQLVLFHEVDLRKRLYQYFTWEEGPHDTRTASAASSVADVTPQASISLTEDSRQVAAAATK